MRCLAREHFGGVGHGGRIVHRGTEHPDDFGGAVRVVNSMHRGDGAVAFGVLFDEVLCVSGGRDEW